MDSSLLVCLIRVCQPASITERGRIVALRLSGVFNETGFAYTTLEAQLTMGICSLDGPQARVAPLKLRFVPNIFRVLPAGGRCAEDKLLVSEFS